MLHCARGAHVEALVAKVGEREAEPSPVQGREGDPERAHDVHAEALRGPP